MANSRVGVHYLPQVINATTDFIVDTRYASFRAGFQVNSVVNSAGTKTAAYGVKAVGTLGGVTYTSARTDGLYASDNTITVAYTAGGTAGSEVVTVVGQAISVQIASGVSTVTQVRTAVNASAAAAALVTATGTSASTVSTTAATAITAMSTPTTGVNSKIDEVKGIWTITAHGMLTGQVVTLTTSAGSLPTGFATSTNYYVFAASANTIQLFDTAAHALAAVPSASDGTTTSTGLIIPTADGTSGATASVIPTALSGASATLYWSNDYMPSSVNGGGSTAAKAGTWTAFTSGETDSVVTANITTTGTVAASAKNLAYNWVKCTVAVSAGSLQVEVIGKVI